jgi:antitoxin component YwqK of YwqJK toxin-antitoxin module
MKKLIIIFIILGLIGFGSKVVYDVFIKVEKTEHQNLSSMETFKKLFEEAGLSEEEINRFPDFTKEKNNEDVVYHKNGNVAAESQEDKRGTALKIYRETGELLVITTFDENHNIVQQSSYTYNSDGFAGSGGRTVLNYGNGEVQSMFSYYADGTLFSEYPYKDGKIHGEGKIYLKTPDRGTFTVVNKFDNGKEISKVSYDEQGKEVSRVSYDEQGKEVSEEL